MASSRKGTATSATLGGTVLGSAGSGIKKLFSKDGWSGKNSFLTNVFDPGRLALGLEDTTPNKKPKAPLNEEAAKAEENERKRIAAGSRSTIVSGRRNEALSANIGKRTLGGSY